MSESPMDKHTALPWEVTGEDCGPGDIPFIEISLPDGPGWRTIAYVQPDVEDFKITEVEKANAEFIVTACNTYYQSQETIKLQQEMIQGQEIRILELEALSKLKGDKS